MVYNKTIKQCKGSAEMRHKAFLRIVPGAETAILFVHGILGTPRHFDMFLPQIPEDISVQAILLAGHGKGVKDFSGASMHQWIDQVDRAVENLLYDHSRVLIAAHSMGTLFAIQQAVKRPEHICGLFLLAAPLRLSIKPAMVRNVTKFYLNKLKPDDPKDVATKECASIAPDKRFWLYLGWLPRYLELFHQIKKTEEIVQQIKTPCMVFQSEHDEMVALSAGKVLAENPAVQLAYLPNSTHYYYEESDKAHVLERFQYFLTEVL